MPSESSLCTQPVVAIVGHIDHGKTTLLDYIRKSAVADKEHGGITQRVSAYEIEHEYPSTDSTRSPQAGSGQTKDGEKRAITFIDTPGHEAFQKMRERAGRAADIAILIVAADDGVKPQTLEAHKAITAANIPFIVAFTKIDKDTASIERAKDSAAKAGIYLEGLGGDVPYVGVSGKTGAGVPELLDLIALSADVHAISCDAAAPAEAIVLESSRDPRSGIAATLIVRRGTATVGGFAVSGSAWAPLRVLEDFTGAKVGEIRCGKPARVSGFTSEPKAGAAVAFVKTKKEAEALAEKNAAPRAAPRAASVGAETETVVLRLVLKADAAGSLEALEYEVGKIAEPKVELLVAGKGVGAVSENDVKLLIGFSPALILGFNVKTESAAADLALRQHVGIETRSVIYELGDFLGREAARLAPEEPEADAAAQILKHFSTSGTKHVVGGKVTEGALKIQDRVVIVRRGVEVGSGKIVNLQMRRADVSAAPAGEEFGAQIETKADVVAGDAIIATRRARPS